MCLLCKLFLTETYTCRDLGFFADYYDDSWLYYCYIILLLLLLLNIVFLIYLFYRDTLTERDSTRKESYKRKRVRHFVVRRFLNQTFYTGEDGTKLHQYQLPYKTMLPLQIFVPRNLSTPPEARRELSPSCLRSGGDSEKSWSRKGVVWAGVEDVIQPESTEFRVSTLVSPARDLTRDVQRT